MRTELDELLLAIPSATYVRELAGLEPRRGGKVTCPFHDDHDPSMQLYGDGTFYCYGCQAGGSIYDFAARLWGLETKRRAFLELRARLSDTLGLQSSSQTATAASTPVSPRPVRSPRSPAGLIGSACEAITARARVAIKTGISLHPLPAPRRCAGRRARVAS